MAHAEAIGVPIPDTRYPLGVDDVEAISKDIEYPSLIKLRKSNSAKGVFKVASPNELVSRYKEVIETFNIADDSLPIIQKFEAGAVYAVSMLFNHGEMRAK
jgi:glutathione synthase/RimK-type ligase-like ATP-grasp enzyme